MTCPICGADAVGQAVRHDPAGESVWQCVNGHRFARVRCETHQRGGGECGELPTLRCTNCSKYACAQHAQSRRSRTCVTCGRRLANTVHPRRPARRGGWQPVRNER